MHEIFPGDGEMAVRCRRLDWERTPLGAPDGWPEHLRTTVRLLLSSRHPMVLFWGPEFVQLYNDAYRPSLGEQGRHPSALGQRAHECWEEIWDVVAPQLAEVRERGRPTWHENALVPITRDGAREEVYWTYGYSPVSGPDGAADGVLVICQETTAQVRAEREARSLGEELSRIFESITDAFFTLDPEWRFTVLNSEAERVLERRREDLLGRVVWDAFPEAAGSTFDREYRRAVAEGVRVQFREYFPPLDRWFQVTAYPSDGGLAVYFQDVSERAAMEERLREREHLLGIAGRVARIGGWEVDVEAGLVRWSDEVCAIHEVPPGTAPTVDEALDFYTPESHPLIRSHFEACVREGRPFDLDLQILTTSGQAVWVRAIGEAIRAGNGSVRTVRGAFQDISRQKQAEVALREADRRLQELAEAMPLIVWSADAQGQVTYQTRAMHDYSGLSPEELKGGGWLEAVHPDDRDGTIAAWEQSFHAGEPYEARFRIRRHDGAWRWHLTRAVPVRRDDGTVARWYGSSTDIHDHLELQREAERLAHRLTVTLESVTDAFCLLDAAGRFTFVNEEAERLLGRSREELLGSVVWESFPAIAGTRLEDEYRRSVLQGTTAGFHYHHAPVDRWFDVRAYPSSEGLAIYFRDITAERESEDRLREQAALLDRAQDAILVRDLEHRIVFWNRSAERIYGWTRDEALGRSIRDLLYESPETFDEATELVLRTGEWHGELAHRRKDGTALTVEGRWSLVRDDEGRPHRILAINTDVTERKALLQQFLRAQRMESVGTLAGGIAHDLNNVLAPILLSIGLLRDELADPHLQETLATIESSARRGGEMVQQILGFARGFERSDLPVHLPQLLRDLGRIVRDTFPRNITFEAQVPEEIWPLTGDPTQIHQVFMNLIVNARDALPQGGRILVTAENVELDANYAAMIPDASPGSHVRISVQDSGIGIPRENLDRIFDPFFTTKEVGKGTGLGLSTVAAIVRSHGGVVNVYSEPGNGTTFRLYFPARTGEAPVQSPAPDEPIRGNGELVLVVDDDGPVRDITRQTLEAFGYRVLTATDGADAVAIYARKGEEIELVLTDMVMPIMDGPTTIRALKRMDPGVRIVAASGLGTNRGIARAADSGVRHFLPKPYTAEVLLGVVHRALRDEAP